MFDLETHSVGYFCLPHIFLETNEHFNFVTLSLSGHQLSMRIFKFVIARQAQSV